MKNRWIITTIFLVLIITTFYFFKWREVNNVLNPNNTKILVLNKTFDFNTIKLQDSINHVFKIKNLSDEDLEIVNVHSNCGCTIANFSKKKIGKGDTAKVHVRFKPVSKGPTEKSIVVEANTSPPFTVLTLVGNVE